MKGRSGYCKFFVLDVHSTLYSGNLSSAKLMNVRDHFSDYLWGSWSNGGIETVEKSFVIVSSPFYYNYFVL